MLTYLWYHYIIIQQACVLAAIQVEPGILSDIKEMHDERLAAAASSSSSSTTTVPPPTSSSSSSSSRAAGVGGTNTHELESSDARRLRLRRQVSETRTLIAAAEKVTEQKVETRAHTLDPLMFPPSMAMHKVCR